MFDNYIRLINQIDRCMMDQVVDWLEERIPLGVKPLPYHVLLLGNGGSAAICSHLAQDFTKLYAPALSPADPSLLTCFANDFGWINAYKEWLGRFYRPGTPVILVSSSGASDNLLACADYVHKTDLVTLTGFHPHNELRRLGWFNFWVDSFSYGEVECIHQIILHTILDRLVERRKLTHA